jgi:predicted nuclease with RNAse H fold
VDQAGHTVVGIDVGGARKGFHAVALRGSGGLERCGTTDAASLAAWCRQVGAELVAVDAPCSWRQGAEARAAERELMREGISCFASPTREKALATTSGFYGWMVCGEALYGELARQGYALAEAADELRSQRRCFETFPHAITAQLHRSFGLEPALAARKREQRRALLERFCVDCFALSSIDWLDAALCALAAQLLRSGAECRVYGEAASGLLLVPVGSAAVMAGELTPWAGCCSRCAALSQSPRWARIRAVQSRPWLGTLQWSSSCTIT